MYAPPEWEGDTMLIYLSRVCINLTSFYQQ